MTDKVRPNPVRETLELYTARLLEAETRLAESVVTDLTTSWWLDPRDLGIGDDPRFLPGGGAVAKALMNRRGRGEFIPAFLTADELSWYRRRIRSMVVGNEIAINAVNQRIAYALGTGLRYEVSPRRDDVDPAVVEAAQTIVDAFCEHNELPLRESETLSRMDIDGEAFLRVFERRGGLLSVRFIEPEFVRSPNGDSSQDSFGVRSSPYDVEDVEGYWVMPTPGVEPELLPACEVLHVKHPETPLTSKRGLSAFFPVEGSLRAAEDLLTSTVSMAKARAKIAWVRKLSGSTSALAQQLVNNQAAYTATDPQTGETLNMERYRTGSIITIPDTASLEMPSANIAAGDHAVVMQMVLRIIASRFAMPEYLLSGDASNANYSSTMVAESPWIKAMMMLQEYLGRHFGGNRFDGHRQSLVWRQLMYAAAQRLLPPNIRSLVDVQVEGPSLTVRDTQKEAQVDQIYNAMKVKSKKTIQMEQGLDPDEEAMSFAEEGAATPGPAAPPVPPPGVDVPGVPTTEVPGAVPA